jgi:hypothetical protein
VRNAVERVGTYRNLRVAPNYQFVRNPHWHS